MTEAGETATESSNRRGSLPRGAAGSHRDGGGSLLPADTSTQVQMAKKSLVELPIIRLESVCVCSAGVKIQLLILVLICWMDF